jgi:3D (Asp-Asp-Asp) domain-containing protein
MYKAPRGAFALKTMNKQLYIKILVIAGLLLYPASIQADIILVAPSATSSSTVTAPTMIVPTAKNAPGLIILAATTTIPATPVVINGDLNKTVYITAYASVPDETSDHPFITASGATVEDGVVAANFLPFGTEIQIPSLFGDKIFTVEDRTSQRFSGRVDIWMATVTQAVDFGIRKAKIVVLDSNVAMQ